MASYWYPLIGWAVFWVGLVLSIILFSIHKKIYPVFYIISISLYVFTAGFVIDVFNLGSSGILLVLVFSALIFMALGYYLSKVLHLESKK